MNQGRSLLRLSLGREAERTLPASHSPRTLLFVRSFAEKTRRKLDKKVLSYPIEHEAAPSKAGQFALLWTKPEPPVEESKQFVFSLSDLLKFSPKRSEQRMQKKIDAFLAVYSPTNPSLAVIIRAFTKMGKFFDAEELLKAKKEKGIDYDPHLVTAIVSLYMTQNPPKFEEVKELLIDVAQWQPLSTETFNVLFTLCAKHNLIREAEEMWRYMDLAFVTRDVITFTALLRIYSESPSTENVEKVRNLMKEATTTVRPDVNMYNSYIDALVRYYSKEAKNTPLKEENEQELLDLVQSMKWAGVSPNLYTFNVLLRYYAMPSPGLLSVKGISSVFEMMGENGLAADVVTYNTIIAAFAQRNKAQQANEWLDIMKKAGISPGGATYSTLISLYCRINNVKWAIKAMYSMLRDGFVPSPHLYAELLLLALEKAPAQYAWRLVGQLQKHHPLAELSPELYNLLIRHSVNHVTAEGAVQKALNFFKEMQIRGIAPTSDTYSALVELAARTANVEQLTNYFATMKELRINPTPDALAAVLNMSEGRIKESAQKAQLLHMKNLIRSRFAQAESAIKESEKEVRKSKKMERRARKESQTKAPPEEL